MENKIRLYNDIDTLTFNNENDKLNIEGYACHYGVPNLNSEVVYKETYDLFFDAYKQKKVIPILNFDHDNNKQIGSIDEITSDNIGLYVKAHVNKNIPWCRDWLIPNIEMGDIKSYSTEMVVVGGMDGIKVNNDGTYVVLNGLLTAVAVVQHPADYRSEFTVRNYLESLKPIEKTKEETPSRWYLFI